MYSYIAVIQFFGIFQIFNVGLRFNSRTPPLVPSCGDGEYVFNVEGVFARFRKGRDASLRDHFRATVWRCASTTTRPTVPVTVDDLKK